MLIVRVVRWRSVTLALTLIVGCLGFTAAAWQEDHSQRQPIPPRVHELMDRALGPDSPFRRLFEEAYEEGRPIPLPPRLLDRLMGSPEGQEFLSEVNRRFFDPRRHEPERFEKQHRDQLREFLPVVQQAPGVALAVQRGGKRVALATAVAADGWLVSKASELTSVAEAESDTADPDVATPPDSEPAAPRPPSPGANEIPLQIIIRGKPYPLEVVATDPDNDLALLHADVTGLLVGSFNDRPPEVGDFVVTPDTDGNVAAVGVISVGVRSLVGADRGFLGVQMKPDSDAVVIERVLPDSAALEAGVHVGDRVVVVDDEKILSMTHMRNVISRHKAGDTVVLRLQRGESDVELTAVLRGQTISGLQAQQFSLMNTLGADPSRRRTDFPAVMQHDSQILPEMAGGPLLDLEGRIVAVNIARGGRVESYAIPSSTVLALVRRMREQQR